MFVFNWNGVKKPNEPRANDITGGIEYNDDWNNDVKYNNVPSPPNTIIKSMFFPMFLPIWNALNWLNSFLWTAGST